MQHDILAYIKCRFVHVAPTLLRLGECSPQHLQEPAQFYKIAVHRGIHEIVSLAKDNNAQFTIARCLSAGAASVFILSTLSALPDFHRQSGFTPVMTRKNESGTYSSSIVQEKTEANEQNESKTMEYEPNEGVVLKHPKK